MKFSSSTVLAMVMTTMPPTVYGQSAPSGTELVDEGSGGLCQNEATGIYDYAYTTGATITIEECDQLCRRNNGLGGLRGFSTYQGDQQCFCWYDDGAGPGPDCPPEFEGCDTGQSASGPINDTNEFSSYNCYRYLDFPVMEASGDPHFRTWKNEHFEFHGQCDILMTKVKVKDLDLEIHLRTKMVCYWSYIKAASIRIGNDILEVEGSALSESGEDKRHYWINFEHLGPLTQLGDFPVTISPRNNKYTIDLGNVYPGKRIEIKTFKEFVGVKIVGATEGSFGSAVGITGDYKTGKTYARDGTTILNDFNELGMEWQVLPSDGKLFHEMTRPQFPELCYLPEDPRGDRARRLDESTISEEDAEKACAGLEDEFSRKGCVYDILATQDVDMVGAY